MNRSKATRRPVSSPVDQSLAVPAVPLAAVHYAMHYGRNRNAWTASANLQNPDRVLPTAMAKCLWRLAGPMVIRDVVPMSSACTSRVMVHDWTGRADCMWRTCLAGSRRSEGSSRSSRRSMNRQRVANIDGRDVLRVAGKLSCAVHRMLRTCSAHRCKHSITSAMVSLLYGFWPRGHDLTAVAEDHREIL